MTVFDPAALRAALTARHWSVATLARALGVPVTTVSGWINGRHRPHWGNVQRMAQGLGVTPEQLTRETTQFTPGLTGAVSLSTAQALVLAVAVALVQQDPESLCAEWVRRLRPADQERLLACLVITPQWAWAWGKLRRLGTGDHPLAPYRVQVRIEPPRGDAG